MIDPVNQAAFWDDRFASDEYVFGTIPNAFLLREAYRVPDNARVLAVADGEGRNSAFMAEKGYKAVATDISERGIEKARRLAADRGVDVDFRQADVTAWEWPSEAFDAVVAIFIQFARHLQRERIFKSMARALKPGGLLLLEGYRPEQIDLGLRFSASVSDCR